MYKTEHTDSNGNPIYDMTGNPILGDISYTVWSDVFICPSCSHELIYWDVAVDKEADAVRDVFICPFCGSKLRKRDCQRAHVTYYDRLVGKNLTIAKQVPVKIVYRVGTKKYEKLPTQNDLELVKAVDSEPIPSVVKVYPLPAGHKTDDPKQSHGIIYAHQFFTTRNLITFATAVQMSQYGRSMFALTSIMKILTKMYRWVPHNKCTAGMPGTLYIPSISHEYSLFDVLERRLRKLREWEIALSKFHDDAIISCGDLASISIPDSTVDYIFTDPPFGANLNYSELSFLWESWLRVITNNKKETIINDVQKKDLFDYQRLIYECFCKYYDALKPGRWITVEFHNSQNAVWNVIQESLQRAGFIVADVRTLDKKQGSYNQTNTKMAVKQDLVISAYKPKESFVREFQEKGGDPEMAWAFVRQHLANVPVTVINERDGKLEIIAERQDYLLFDRMVAWHIMNGVPVPLDAHDFYAGLRERFIERDGMFFLPDQVNEYDDKKMRVGLEVQQLSFVVSNEKSAIEWLRYMLSQRPMTYQQIQPEYLQQVHQNKTERMPELLDMLDANFVQDDDGAWYIPDPARAADKAKLRRKSLVREFRDYAKGSGKLRTFRMEAIRAGFDECWRQRDYDTIVKVGGRLPDSAFEDDAAVLMYYDNACARAGK